MTDKLAGLGQATLPARRTTPDHVADVVREGILCGVLDDGDELNQAALAKHFGVSRVPVREALRQLQAEGLVRQEAHRRAVVTTLTTERITELFDLRVRLECYLLEQATKRVEARDVRRLRTLLRRGEKISSHGDWLRYNTEFHRTLGELASATYTLELVQQISARTTRYLYLRSGGGGVERQHEAHAEHIGLVDAVEAGDVVLATARLTSHIEATRSRVELLLAPSGQVRSDGAASEHTA